MSDIPPNGGKPVIQNLDILLDLDDASHALYNAAAHLRQVGLTQEAIEVVELADKVLEKQASLRTKYGRF